MSNSYPNYFPVTKDNYDMLKDWMVNLILSSGNKLSLKDYVFECKTTTSIPDTCDIHDSSVYFRLLHMLEDNMVLKRNGDTIRVTSYYLSKIRDEKIDRLL